MYVRGVLTHPVIHLLLCFSRRREFWNVPAKLVRKLEGEEVGVEVDDGCRKDVAKIGWATEVDLEVMMEEHASAFDYSFK